MTWIKTLTPEEASGRLKTSYDAAIQRAGYVAGIVRSMSQHPGTLDASMAMYGSIMFRDGSLSRRQCEMLATVVSRVNDCHY
tara:strand:- start:14994 stop:15239 length:246 start_codon:yes stop_codon:yes gene_type:complete